MGLDRRPRTSFHTKLLNHLFRWLHLFSSTPGIYGKTSISKVCKRSLSLWIPSEKRPVFSDINIKIMHKFGPGQCCRSVSGMRCVSSSINWGHVSVFSLCVCLPFIGKFRSDWIQAKLSTLCSPLDFRLFCLWNHQLSVPTCSTGYGLLHDALSQNISNYISVLNM